MKQEQKDKKDAVIRSDGQFWLGDDGIVRVAVPAGSDDTLDKARASLEEIRKVGNGVPRPVLVDIRGIRSATLEARHFWSSDALIGVVAAAALLIDSPVSRVLGNFYMGINRMHVPAHLFADEAEALQWLEPYRTPGF